MHKLFLILATCFALTSISGCFDNEHSHDTGSHIDDNSQPKHKSID